MPYLYLHFFAYHSHNVAEDVDCIDVRIEVIEIGNDILQVWLNTIAHALIKNHAQLCGSQHFALDPHLIWGSHLETFNNLKIRHYNSILYILLC